MLRALGVWLGVAGLVLSSGCGGAGSSRESAPADWAARSSTSEHTKSVSREERAPPAISVAAATAPAGPAAPAERGDAAPPVAPASRPASGAMPEPSRSPAYRIQSGTLTAGSVDDHERLDDYRRYLSQVLQWDAREKLPRMDIGHRVVILVENGQGLPVADARVVIRPIDERQGQQGDSGPALLDVTTAADGRAMFFSGMDGARGRAKLSVAVYPPGGATPVTQVVGIESPLCRVRLPSLPERRVSRLDLALVIDCTGSMSDELEYLKAEIDGIVAAVHRMFPQVDQRFALVAYRDQGDEYVTRTFDFTGSLEEFRSTLSQQHAEGGGDYPEAVHLALAEAGKLSWRKEGTARIAFLVGDAPPHEEFFRETMDAVSALRRRSVRVYPVGGSGVDDSAEFIFRATAFLTQAEYLFLTDHSGVGDSHATPHVPDYQVERLDRLMLRMIASELAGRKLPATEIIAIEGGQSPYARAQIAAPEHELNAPPPAESLHEPAGRRRLGWLPASSAMQWTLLVGLLVVGRLAQDFVSRRNGGC
jgi:hypothetical protein